MNDGDGMREMRKALRIANGRQIWARHLERLAKPVQRPLFSTAPDCKKRATRATGRRSPRAIANDDD